MWVGIEFWEFEDISKAEILESEIAIGSITAYANLQDLDQSLKIKLADNIADNVYIQFKVSVWSGDNQDNLTFQKVEFKITNAIIFNDYITEDTTFTKDKKYIIANHFAISNNSTLH